MTSNQSANRFITRAKVLSHNQPITSQPTPTLTPNHPSITSNQSANRSTAHARCCLTINLNIDSTDLIQSTNGWTSNHTLIIDSTTTRNSIRPLNPSQPLTIPPNILPATHIQRARLHKATGIHSDGWENRRTQEYCYVRRSSQTIKKKEARSSPEETSHCTSATHAKGSCLPRPESEP
jgi:hypothetical protein